MAAGRQERRRRQRAAVARERQRIFGPIRQAGVALLAGGAPEATQLVAQISQLGGGTGVEMRRQGLLRAGFAARSLFGVGPDVAGAFLQAGRRGGLVGGAGRAGEALTDALRQAMELGLEGSEINDYVRAVAEGITSWKQTGIRINARSIASMGQSPGRPRQAKAGETRRRRDKERKAEGGKSVGAETQRGENEVRGIYATVNRRDRDAAAAAVVRLVRGEK